MEKERISHMILHNRVLLVGALILLAVATATVAGLCLPQHRPTIQGQLETTDYRVASKVASRVVRLAVAEGDRIRRGDTLALLSAPELTAREQAALAAARAAEARDRLTHEGTRREQVQAALAQWQQAQAALGIREQTYRRQQHLYEQGVVAQQKRDEALAARDGAAAQERAAAQAYAMARAGARREERLAARATARSARATAAQVAALVAETVLLAPRDGVVTEVFVEPGEIVGTGAPIMNVETSEAWFSFYLTEDKLRGLDYGRRVQVYRPSTGDTVEARITRINNAGDFAAWKPTRALEDMDLKLFDVRATPVRPLSHAHGGQSAVLLLP